MTSTPRYVATLSTKNRLGKYGITPEDFLRMLATQEGRCAVCGAYFGDGRRDGPQVDHCHETGAVRGLVHAHCNRVLGNAKDSPELLRSAANYLEAAKDRHARGELAVAPKTGLAQILPGTL